MSKNYEVVLTYSYTIAVEGAESGEAAIEFALECCEASMGNMVEAEANPVTNDTLWTSVCKHADDVARDE